MSVTSIRARSRKGGFTLIEILIALVVLFIGIVGIIALFPVGIDSTRHSVQDTQAAIFGESIHHAIVMGMRTATTAAGTTTVTLCHDGCPKLAAGPAQVGYQFTLPLTAAGTALPWPETHHPTGSVSYLSPGPVQEIFQMGRSMDGAVSADAFEKSTHDVLVDIRAGDTASAPTPTFASDPTIDYSQYFWDFYVSQVPDPALNPLPLYQFRIRVWRNYQPGDWALPDAGTPTKGEMIQEFRVLVASNS